MRGPRGAGALVTAFVGAGLLVGLLGFSSTLNPIDALLGRGAIVSVPNLMGRPQPGAEADVRAAGLVPAVRTSYSLTGKRGTVIAQTPAAGSRVREGSKVDVVISRGVNRVEMPDAVGKAFTDVRKPLDEAGVEVKVDRRPTEDVAKGVVISQEPGPGVLVTGEDTASFAVSDGPAKRAVPDVSGLSIEGAAFQLGKAGLTIGVITPTDDAAAVIGSVLRTDPAAGAVVARDTVVNLAQAAGPPPVAVPPLVGQTPDAASAALKALGLVANVIRQVAGPGQGAGQNPALVTAQDPPEATALRPRSVVTLAVGPGG